MAATVQCYNMHLDSAWNSHLSHEGILRDFTGYSFCCWKKKILFHLCTCYVFFYAIYHFFCFKLLMKAIQLKVLLKNSCLFWQEQFGSHFQSYRHFCHYSPTGQCYFLKAGVAHRHKKTSSYVSGDHLGGRIMP